MPAKPGPLSLSVSQATRAACLPLLLAACSGEAGGAGAQSGDASTAGASISCAIGGAQAFTDSCTVERAQVEGAPVLVVRHADGGFRRFTVEGGSLTEADGAEQAVVSRSGSTIDVSVGADRYRLDAGLLGNGQ